jgi:hypothetical protein
LIELGFFFSRGVCESLAYLEKKIFFVAERDVEARDGDGAGGAIYCGGCLS